jgi:2-isopropylmalate synthase
VTTLDGTKKWGVGIDTDIIVASIKGVLSALNR